MATLADISVGYLPAADSKSGADITVAEHNMIDPELSQVISDIGVRDNSTDYNTLIDGYGTGLALTTLQHWHGIRNSAKVA